MQEPIPNHPDDWKKRLTLRMEQAEKMFQFEPSATKVDNLFSGCVDPLSIKLKMNNYMIDRPLSQTNQGLKTNMKVRQIIKDAQPTKEETVLSKRKLDQVSSSSSAVGSSSTALQLFDDKKDQATTSIVLHTPQRVEDTQKAMVAFDNSYYSLDGKDELTRSLILQEKRRRKEIEQKPKWHPPWKLMRVISGHTGWVRAISVDISNEWFATGSNDRTIKIWDLASGELKLTLPGHTSTVRDLVVSDRSPYLFSVGEDKSVRCWDLETNKCIRQYRGHLSGVYCCALHPSLDLLATGARDSSCRIWDIRTKKEVFLLTGHESTVASVLSQEHEPQVITGSMDSTIRLWDLKTGTTRTTLTHHKKSVRTMTLHPTEYTFGSASADSIKKWKCPEGKFMLSYEGTNEDVIIHAMTVNNDGVLVCAADDGTLDFWDWKTGHHFSSTKNIPQPGSLDSESAVLACKFDRSGARLITGGADKSIKIYRPDDTVMPPTEEENEQKFYISNLFGKKKY
ncbi:hypothetical protein C9374_001703 [Naegleria lovaniensis]|uniref:Guanine nucleotide-binding protein subunit beta-like protein n=1 Tax=Naegleria lovaniensis TaxID=51637 RepID=A0AA88KNA5_NAELO|nr:uncharacterized protein C9374_001703 [Naegleria lovaniensis]KAG2387371.1 hypothetical protein C9374_001703 [Naegleria lovaniensis]